jgi:hypothetical protein
MNFIKKVFDGKIDELVHLQFQKFSRGEFRDRAVIRAKCSAGKYTINTTAEFANELVRDIAEELGENKTNITGAIVSTSDLKGKIEFTEIKQFQGVKRYLIDKEMSGKELIKLLDEFPKTFFALSFSSKDSTLKIKPKAPKSGKPSTKDAETPKPDFCILKTTNKNIGASFIFEKPSFKTAEAVHKFVIEKIEAPIGEKDFAKMREMAKRVGKIIRNSKIDDKEEILEKEFSA